MSIKAGIIGASGYTGAELMRLLALHPRFELAAATAESQAGKTVGELYPSLSGYAGLQMRKLGEVKGELAACDVVFCALPHGEAMNILPALKVPLIVDLGSDFRLKNAEDYETWHKRSHTAAAELPNYVYGLPELFRDRIKGAKRIANPGCYATAAILALGPLYKAGLVAGHAVADAVSGLSGAGRNPSPGMHFSHAFEDVRSYKAGTHQHTPEMEQAVKSFSGAKVTISFTPHLVPMSRGIHATCSAQTADGVSRAKLLDALRGAYSGEPFVTVSEEPPGTKEVRGSNTVRLSVFKDERTGRAIVTSVLDNLVKGASGQAIQNANIALGLDETLGLPREGVYP